MPTKIKWIHGAALLAIIFILRLPAFWTPILDIDESQFAGFAHTLLKGGLPYVHTLDTKPLGIYYFFAAIFAIFGKNDMIAVHIITALWVGLTALFCYRIAAKIYSPRAGLIAALYYAIFTTAYVPKFISTSIIVLMMLPLTMSIDLFLSWEQSGRRRYLLLSGITWGLACLFKYHAGINLIVIAMYLLLFRPLYMERSFAAAKIKPLLIFIAGGVIVGAVFALHLIILGVWDEFFFWSLQGSLAYINAGTTIINFWQRLIVRGGTIVASAFVLWFFGLRRTAHLVRDLFLVTRHRRLKCEEYLILIWFALSLLAVSTGGRFYGHYFLQLYPALCVLAAGSTMRFFAWLRGGEVTRARQWAYGLFVAGLLVPAIGFFGARLMADHIYKAIGEENPKNYRPIAEYVKERTEDGDHIFVWGFATPIYYFSDRLPGSRFLWCDWMTGRVAGTPSKGSFFDTSSYVTRGAWGLFFEDMTRTKPVYFIDTSPGNHHGYGRYPVANYPKMKEWLDRYYEFEQHVDGADIYRRMEH